MTAEQSGEPRRVPGASGTATGIIANSAVSRSGMDADASDTEVRRHGCFVHELRNHLGTAMLAFQVMKGDRVLTQRTMDVFDRSLRGLRDLIDRSVAEVRLAAVTHRRERVQLSTFMEEMESDASFDARSRGLRFHVDQVDDALFVEVDRHLFGSAIANLLQNAFKFTRPSSQVWLRVHSIADRVAIGIEDECGGLPPGAAEVIFRPFEQRGSNRTGLGLGLTISREAIEANGGTLSVRDLPGKGCVFTVEMPLAIGCPRAEAVEGGRNPEAEGVLARVARAELVPSMA